MQFFLSSADFFQNQYFEEKNSGIPSNSVKQFGPKLFRLSANDTSRQ